MPARPLADAPAPSPDTTLPGLRGLAKLADLRPMIAIDTREKGEESGTRSGQNGFLFLYKACQRSVAMVKFEASRLSELRHFHRR